MSRRITIEVSAREQLLAIKRAVKASEVQTVRRLLLKNPELVVARGHGWTPLQDAAFQAKAHILKVMLVRGVGITSADVAHALHHAVQLPHTDPQAVEVLLATEHVSELFAALYRQDLEAFGSCLRADPGLSHSTDPTGCPVLLRAAENGEEMMVRLLLAHGADIEARGPYEQSALASCACNQIDRTKRSKTLRLLLASGADVNGRIHQGRTPLFSAATAGWAPEESVKILLEHGADPRITNDEGRTVLEEVLSRPTARSRRVAKLLRDAAYT
jgi:ankyrin repeat protein